MNARNFNQLCTEDEKTKTRIEKTEDIDEMGGPCMILLIKIIWKHASAYSSTKKPRRVPARLFGGKTRTSVITALAGPGCCKRLVARPPDALSHNYPGVAASQGGVKWSCGGRRGNSAPLCGDAGCAGNVDE